MNRALILNWLWWFGEEGDKIKRKVIAAKYGNSGGGEASRWMGSMERVCGRYLQRVGLLLQTYFLQGV